MPGAPAFVPQEHRRSFVPFVCSVGLISLSKSNPREMLLFLQRVKNGQETIGHIGKTSPGTRAAKIVLAGHSPSPVISESVYWLRTIVSLTSVNSVSFTQYFLAPESL